ncbi:hypothetical protein STEG23_010250 [Scotinomys teguina]
MELEYNKQWSSEFHPYGFTVSFHAALSIWKLLRHSPTSILMQREDVISEWIFLPRKPNKKLKTYIEKISDLIHKGEEKLWIPTKLIKIRFEQEKPLDEEK